MRSVGHGDFLQAGDHYNLRIVADRPAYLSVLLIGSSGQRTLLAPAASAPPIPPGTATVIPESDVLTVGPGGPERVFVIAAPTRRTAAQVQALVAQAGEASAEEVRDPPPISGPANRPVEPTKLQLASFGADGSAALWFALAR